MTHEVATEWMGKMQFNALVNGHTIVMDAPERVGGTDAGPIPKPFVLAALSGCTGMDVAALLRKQDIALDSLNIKVIGELSKAAPITYTAIHLIYELGGKPEYLDASLKAITDSQEKYCGVSFLLKKAIPVSWELNYNGTLCFDTRREEQLANSI